MAGPAATPELARPCWVSHRLNRNIAHLIGCLLNVRVSDWIPPPLAFGLILSESA